LKSFYKFLILVTLAKITNRMNIENLHALFLNSSGITTDTRKIEKNSLFFALKGANFNGNSFAEKALELGAKAVIIDEKEFQKNENCILVPDVLETLQELARFHRRYLNITIVGLTGSNGKTTTKELIHAVLSQKFKTKATIGNLNNHIGVPLTLLSFDKSTEIGIVEMGANHQKEIELLSSICEPDLGYITNFGKAHLEGFGGVEGVIKGKSELYQNISSRKKKVIVNLDDAIQKEKTANMDTVSFGQNNTNAFINITEITANPMVKIIFENTTIQSHLIGIYNANNINAAITIGKYFGLTNEQIKTGIEHYVPNNNRSQLLEKNSNKVILDAYNANPSSMQAALTNFFQLTENNKIAILGDMFELGEESNEEHEKLVNFCLNNTEIEFHFVGQWFYECKNTISNMNFYEDFDSLKNSLESKSIQNSLLLIKGSRGMSLERTLEFI
jgi:UDP-N-acetylmuramoyl-tripeptide--D-alanyl-D-alanine ligase